MDIILLASATGLVLRKYLNIRKIERNIENEQFKKEIVETVQTEEVETEPESSDEEQEQPEQPEPEPLGIDHQITSGGLPFTPENESSFNINPKHDNRNVTSLFNEQFFPEDGRTTGSYNTRPKWADLEKEFKHRKESLEFAPTPEDTFRIKQRADIRAMGDRYTANPLHQNNSKIHYSPEGMGIWTGNGNFLTDGYHPKNHGRLYKILPPDNDTINIHNTVQGMVGFKSDNTQETQTNDRQEKNITIQTGIPTGPVARLFQKAFTCTVPSNAENYNISKQYEAASRAPGGKVAYKNNNTVTEAFDEEIETFKNLVYSSIMKNSKGGEMEKMETRFKSAEIERPTVSGANGGVITLPTSKDSEIKTTSSLENLGLSMSNVKSSVGSRGVTMKKSAEGSMEMAEPRLFETENIGGTRRTTSNLKKSFQVGGDFSINDDRENISSSEFTSKNFIAKPNESLGINKFNPTGSMSLVGRQNVLKEESGVAGFDTRLANGFDRSKLNNRSTVKEMEENQNKSLFQTIFNDRMNLGVGPKKIDTRKDLGRNTIVDI